MLRPYFFSLLLIVACAPASSERAEPEAAEERPRVVQVSAGYGHALALLSDSTVVSWGGDGPLAAARGGDYDEAWVPRRVRGLPPICQVEAAAGSWAMAIDCEGRVWSWGTPREMAMRDYGRLGAGGGVWRPGRIAGLRAIRDVAGGSNHGLAVDSQGVVYSWGDPEMLARSLPEGITEDDAVSDPGPIEGLPPARAVEAGIGISFVITEEGALYNWGLNNWGELGRKTPNHDLRSLELTADYAPRPVSNIYKLLQLVTKPGHTLALTVDSTVWGWGSNRLGPLGSERNIGTRKPHLTPQELQRLPPARTIAGGSGHSLSLSADSTIWSWGGNFDGQLGYGPISGRNDAHPNPKPIPDLPPVAQIAAHGYSSYALTADGQILSWGNNYLGQLGRPERFGEEPGTPTPAPVRLDSAFVQHAEVR